MRIVVALGGNALVRPGRPATWPEAVDRMRATAGPLAELVATGHELILTHGNGPQIGGSVVQNELGRRDVPPRPMDVLGAETQGQIGYLIQQELGRALAERRLRTRVVTVITRVEVSPRDAAFRQPVKPIGRYYAEPEMRLVRKREGWSFAYDSARGGWRRVVPSPRPVDWLERDAVCRWLTDGAHRRVVLVVGGGGGIPVVRRSRGGFEGVEAVIDKDRTAAMLARDLQAQTLAIVTDVPGVAVGFGTPAERWLGTVDVDEVARALAGGEFGAGTMAPKVEAVLEFLRGGGRHAVITDIPSLPRALRGEAGTRISRS